MAQGECCFAFETIACYEVQWTCCVTHIAFVSIVLHLSHRIIPRISTSSSPGILSLDETLHEWTLVERQYEENSSHPLKDAQQGQAGTARRRPLSYAFDMAAQKWSREMPTL